MLTKEECEEALENAVDTKIIIKDWKVLNKLIEEHFDPKPYTFEELHEGMWVWDDRTKNCGKIRETFIKEIVNQKTQEIRQELRIKFKWGESVYEENRFYPVEKANQGK